MESNSRSFLTEAEVLDQTISVNIATQILDYRIKLVSVCSSLKLIPFLTTVIIKELALYSPQ